MLKYAIETQKMDQIMSRLHRLFDIRITFFDLQEQEIEKLPVKPATPFCIAFRKNKTRAEQCEECDQTHLAEAKRLEDVHIYHCHSGLIEGMVPLYNRRRIYLGAIVFGQLRDAALPAHADWTPTLKRLYEALPVYTMERALDVGHILKCVSESMIERELISYHKKPWADALDNYIEAHLHEKITAIQLATATGRSSSFVAHHFESEFGQTPRQYILQRKMEEARIILENGESVQNTAARLGFYDAFHFSKTFKNFWDTSPSSYRPT